MTLIVTETGRAWHYRSALPCPGYTPLMIEPENGKFLLVQFDFRHTAPLDQRRRVLSEHATEREAEQAAARFVDGPPKPVKPPRKQPHGSSAKRANTHARIVGKAVRR